MSEKTIADVINLRSIIEEVLRDYQISESQRLEISQKIFERYKNSVRVIATKYLEKEA